MTAANEQVLLWINGLVGKWSLLDSFMRLVVNDYFIPVAMSLVLLGLWFAGRNLEEREHNQMTVFCAAAGIGLANVIVKICNWFYDTARPFNELPEVAANVPRIFYFPTDPSSPANIAAIAFAMAAGVWLGNRKPGYLLFVAAFMVSLARVYAGVHYPLDILAGAAVGLLSAMLAHWVVIPLLRPFFKSLIEVGRKLCLA